MTATPADSSVASPVVSMFKSDVPIPEKDGITLPSWLVAVEVEQSGRRVGSTIAIVDTGAQASVVDAQWAAEVGIDAHLGEVVAQDISGQSIPTEVARATRFHFGAIETRVTDVPVIAFPELLRRLGIGIIWSPHTSVPEGALLRIDLEEGTLSRTTEDELASTAEDLCIGEGFSFAAPIVDAQIAGINTRVELDTGASSTSIAMDSPAGQALAARTDGKDTASHGAAGRFATRELPPQHVRVGSVASEVQVDLFEREPPPSENNCNSDGVVGLPFLSRCTLEFTTTRFSLRCH